MVQAKAIRELQQLIPEYTSIEIETSGVCAAMLIPCVSYNVSPKLRHAQARVPYDLATLRNYMELQARFKFVVKTLEDFEEIERIQQQIGLPADRVWIMPEGIDVDAQLTGARALIDEIVKRNYNLSLRQHVLIWGNERGR